jgi:hypothetical protein
MEKNKGLGLLQFGISLGMLDILGKWSGYYGELDESGDVGLSFAKIMLFVYLIYGVVICNFLLKFKKWAYNVNLIYFGLNLFIRGYFDSKHLNFAQTIATELGYSIISIPSTIIIVIYRKKFIN